jgi:hypothetical protein
VGSGLADHGGAGGRHPGLRGPQGSPSSVTLITEALGYLGAALVAAGWSLRRTEDDAIARLASVLWLLAAGLSGWFGGQLASDGFDASDQGVALGVGIGVTVTAVPLYLVRRRTLQQLAVIAGLMILAAGTFWGSGMSVGLAYLVIGFAWTALGWMGRAEPRRVSLTSAPDNRHSARPARRRRHPPRGRLRSRSPAGAHERTLVPAPRVDSLIAVRPAELRALQPGMPSSLAFRFLSDFMASPRMAG